MGCCMDGDWLIIWLRHCMALHASTMLRIWIFSTCLALCRSFLPCSHGRHIASAGNDGRLIIWDWCQAAIDLPVPWQAWAGSSHSRYPSIDAAQRSGNGRGNLRGSDVETPEDASNVILASVQMRHKPNWLACSNEGLMYAVGTSKWISVYAVA